jgi:hypothetical protein
MDSTTIVTLAVTLFIALSGYFVKYYIDLQLARRKDTLERINQQLRDLYGPLFALIKASNTTWQAWKGLFGRDPSFRMESGIRPQNEETERVWRHWIRHVFMPLNLQMSQLIIEHADLLDEEEIHPSLLQLSAHVHGYKGIIAAWDEKDYSVHMSLINFPGKALEEYATNSYKKLKSRQAKLLEKVQRQ